MPGQPLAPSPISSVPDDRVLLRRISVVGLRAMAVFGMLFPLADTLLFKLSIDGVERLVLRWMIMSAVTAVLSMVFTRRMTGLVSQSLNRERHARRQAEGLADLATSMALGNTWQDTLSAAVTAGGRMFRDQVRCGITLPSDDGLLRLVAWNHPGTARLATFAFEPGRDWIGQAFAEGRLVRVDDVRATPAGRPDVVDADDARALMIAPLTFERRTLGVMTAASATPGAFDERDERMLTAVARSVALALAAAEAREAAAREAAALRESEERYRRLVELCPDPIIVHCEGVIAYANPAALSLAGAANQDQVIGRYLLDFVPAEHRPRFLAAGGLERADATFGSGPIQRLDGEIIEAESTTMPIVYDGRPAVQAVMRDVTLRKRAERALAHQALHDSLTGLPNREFLMECLGQALTSERVGDASLALLLMDLDRFKEVNDCLGHHAGDVLLRQISDRLREVLRDSETLARLGGDEFAIIVPRTTSEGVSLVVERLLEQLHAPFIIEGQTVIIGASIGIALAPEHATEVDALLRRADVAMYTAKRAGSGSATYAAELDGNSPDRLVLVGDPRRVCRTSSRAA